MSVVPLDIVIFGLSITSAWGNGHATTYRALVRALVRRGHRVRFFERDVPWYAEHRDMRYPPWGTTTLYGSVQELRDHFPDGIDADVAVLGSYVPDAVQIAEWMQRDTRGITAFYDIDTPITVAALERGTCPYLTRESIPKFDLYLSFAGGPVLERLAGEFGAQRVRPLYCSVDVEQYAPIASRRPQYRLGYLGTYSADRQATLDRLLLQPARALPNDRFIVAGAQYPESLVWPANVTRVEHCPPSTHREFYANQAFTLNVTRADMLANGWSPSVRLFEAAACGTPIISDRWIGLDAFFAPGEELLVADSTRDVLALLNELSERDRLEIADRARARVLGAHTADHRAREFESYVIEACADTRAKAGAQATSSAELNGRSPGASMGTSERSW